MHKNEEDFSNKFHIVLTKLYISNIEIHSAINLKAINVKINGNSLEFTDFEHKKGIPIFQWCSASKNIRLFYPDGVVNSGLVEDNIDDLDLAKMYLNAEVYTSNPKWTECIDYCNKVINEGGFSLDDSYSHIFMADNNTSPEIIFPICFDGKYTQTWG